MVARSSTRLCEQGRGRPLPRAEPAPEPTTDRPTATLAHSHRGRSDVEHGRGFIVAGHNSTRLSSAWSRRSLSPDARVAVNLERRLREARLPTEPVTVTRCWGRWREP